VVKSSQRQRSTGSIASGKMGGHVPPKISGEHRVWLIERIASSPFTLRGLVAELSERGLRVDYRTMWKFVHAEGLSFKKTVLASEQDRPDIARKRARWKARQATVDPRRLVSSSTRPGRRPTWRRCGAGDCVEKGSWPRPLLGIGRR
jgi:transposase